MLGNLMKNVFCLKKIVPLRQNLNRQNKTYDYRYL